MSGINEKTPYDLYKCIYRMNSITILYVELKLIAYLKLAYGT